MFLIEPLFQILSSFKDPDTEALFTETDSALISRADIDLFNLGRPSCLKACGLCGPSECQVQLS